MVPNLGSAGFGVNPPVDLGGGRGDPVAVLAASMSLAYHLGEAGDRAEALTRLRDLASTASILGDDHQVALRARGAIAYFTAKSGEYNLAKSLYDEVVATGTRVNGAAHDYVLVNRANAAECVGAMGDPVRALQELATILTDSVATCGPDDPTTLNCRRLIAHFTGAAGDTDQALAQLRTLLDDCQRLLDENHSGTLECLDSLAIVSSRRAGRS